MNLQDKLNLNSTLGYEITFFHDDLPSVKGNASAETLEKLLEKILANHNNLEPLDVIALDNGRTFWIMHLGFTEFFKV